MTPRKNKPLIYGPDGRRLVRVNDRLAPKPRASAGLEGWVSWGLIDRKGREVAGGEQHNLILDTFLDRMAVADLSKFASFLSHFAVGTGSTPPAVTDTALANELARTTTQTASGTTRTANGVYDLTLEREFDFAVGNGNLTEFGFSYGPSSPMLVRELFRDNGGNPITITKTSDYKLRIKYTLSVALSPVTPTPISFPLTGVGTINGVFMFIGGNGPGYDLNLFAQLAGGSSPPIPALSNTPVTTYTATVSYTGTGGRSRPAYVGGSYSRTLNASWSTSQGNMPSVAAIGVQRPGSTGAAFTVNVDPADRFTKDSLHTLAIDDVLTVSWGRA